GHRAGLDVDLDHRDVGPEGERRVGAVEVALVPQRAGVEPVGQAGGVAGGGGQHLPGQRPVGYAGHVQAPVAGDDVVGAGLEQVRGDLPAPGQHLLGGGVDG